MKLIRNTLAVGAIAAASVVACSSQHGSGTGTVGNGGPQISALPGNQGASDTGSIRAALTIVGGNGASLYSLNYTCTGPSVIPPGSVNFGDAQSVEWTLGGIADGGPYQCVLSGTDSQGALCSGTTSPFTISPGAVTGSSVNVVCNVATDASTGADVTSGSVAFEAGVSINNQGAYQCPGISSFSISPAEVIGSQPAALSLSEIGPSGLAADGGVSASNIIWTATCGTPPCGSFNPSANSASPTFVCGPDTADQIVTIVAQVTNYESNITTGVVSDVCAGQLYTTMHSTIDCEGGGTFSCAAFPGTSVCPGNTCKNLQTDPANCGVCGNACTDPTKPNCTAGLCTGVVLPPPGPCTASVGGVPQDVNGNTACIQCDQNTSKVCTPTEAILVQRDIEKGLVTGSKPTPSSGNKSGSCYECAVAAGAIDSDIQGFAGEECQDDLTGTGAASSQSCLNAINCYLGSPQDPAGTPGLTGVKNPAATIASLTADCTNESPAGVFNCFCGSNEPDVTNCKKAGTVFANASGGLGLSSPNGVCQAQIFAGTGDTSQTINANIVTDMGAATLGAGLASDIVQLFGSQAASGQACSQCYQ